MKRLINNKGFTLVELMVAIAILGLVLMAISTTFIGQRRQNLTQDEIAESQQSARIGLETLVRDIRRAGIMTPTQSGRNPIENAGNFNIAILTGSETNAMATILTATGADPGELSIGNITGIGPANMLFTVDDAREFQDKIGSTVKIIRPSEWREAGTTDGVSNACYSITAQTPTTVTLNFVNAASLPGGGVPAIIFKAGDIIILHNCVLPWPLEINYYLDPDPVGTPGTTVLRNLVRWIDADSDGVRDPGETVVIAENIIVPDANADGTPDDRDGNGWEDFVFTYFDENGNRTSVLSNINSVRVDLTSATTRNVAQINNEARTRQLISLTRIKSREFE